MEWRLETGRTHQIRVHAREIGIPILGDETYGGAGNGAEERLRSKGAMTPAEAKRVAKISRRPMLHAQTLGFRHPRTGGGDGLQGGAAGGFRGGVRSAARRERVITNYSHKN